MQLIKVSNFFNTTLENCKGIAKIEGHYSLYVFAFVSKDF